MNPDSPEKAMAAANLGGSGRRQRDRRQGRRASRTRMELVCGSICGRTENLVAPTTPPALKSGVENITVRQSPSRDRSQARPHRMLALVYQIRCYVACCADLSSFLDPCRVLPFLIARGGKTPPCQLWRKEPRHSQPSKHAAGPFRRETASRESATVTMH